MSTMIIAMLVIFSLVIVFQFAVKVVDRSRVPQEFSEIENYMLTVDKSIHQVYSEGNGSIRKVSLRVPDGNFKVNSREDSIIYTVDGPPVGDYLSRKKLDNLYRIYGNDLNCYESGTNIVMENSFIKLILSKFGSESSWSYVNTSKLLKTMYLKPNWMISFNDTSIFIDGNKISGNGYGELISREDEPFCVAEFFVSPNYYIRYILFPGADFVIEEIDGSGNTIKENFEFETISGFSTSHGPDYLMYNNSNIFFSVIFAGSKLIDLSMTDNSFSLTQSMTENKLFIVFTNSTDETFRRRLDEVRKKKFVSTRFGNFNVEKTDMTKNFLVLMYRSIDILNNARWGSGSVDILIKNTGKGIRIETT